MGTLCRTSQATDGRPFGSKICQPNTPPRCHPEPSTHVSKVSPRVLGVPRYLIRFHDTWTRFRLPTEIWSPRIVPIAMALAS